MRELRSDFGNGGLLPCMRIRSCAESGQDSQSRRQKEGGCGVNLEQIISDIQQSECVNCKFGKALIALKALKDETEPQGGVGVVKATRSPRKIKKAPEDKPHRRSDTRRAILEYLSRHPSSKNTEIGSALALPRATVAFHLLRARKANQVQMIGKAANSRWSITGVESTSGSSDSSGLEPPTNLAPLTDDKKRFYCSKCSKAFLNLYSLQEHKRLKHGE
jgi:DNA-binding transcriptional ArsR family regulator